MLNDDQRDRYIEYLAAYSVEKYRNYHSAFTINPDYPESPGAYFGNRTSKKRTFAKAVSNCGPDCLIYAIDRKVVWKDAMDKAELDEIADNMADGFDIEIKYFNEVEFELSEKQRKRFEDQFIAQKAELNRLNMAYAVSPDGEAASMIRINKKSSDQELVERMVLVQCNSLTENNDCVVYAYNRTRYTD
ncbi:hypothetical protein [Curvivirga aplysinae]|uniref:hypothetical protein n=1 Tax=Curvivirga aplysinae TaxID=2529852 RepID=UPI0012BCF442|nr:hypothetical protein [Curvivirga aplysinae]MTI09689.1 hypothetical protein [Curvivirga aplysinae]